MRDRKICSGITEDRRLWPVDTAPPGQMSNRTPGWGSCGFSIVVGRSIAGFARDGMESLGGGCQEL